jgi:hypothetical protein
MTLVTTDFTGSNGAAWPSPWSTSLFGGSAGGAVDIQSNRGRMRAHDGGYRIARASASGITVTDATFEVTFNLVGVTEQYGYIWFRTSGDWASGSEWVKNGYGLYVGAYPSGDLGLVRASSGAETSIAGGSFTWTAGVDYKAKINFVGATLRAKVWLASGSEPSGWTLQASDGTYTSGGVDLSLLSGATANTRQWTLDDITVTAANPAAATQSAYTAYITATTDVDPGGSSGSEYTDWVFATTDVEPGTQVRKFRRAGVWVDTSDRKLRRSGTWV